MNLPMNVPPLKERKSKRSEEDKYSALPEEEDSSQIRRVKPSRRMSTGVLEEKKKTKSKEQKSKDKDMDSSEKRDMKKKKKKRSSEEKRENSSEEDATSSRRSELARHVSCAGRITANLEEEPVSEKREKKEKKKKKRSSEKEGEEARSRSPKTALEEEEEPSSPKETKRRTKRLSRRMSTGTIDAVPALEEDRSEKMDKDSSEKSEKKRMKKQKSKKDGWNGSKSSFEEDWSEKMDDASEKSKTKRMKKQKSKKDVLNGSRSSFSPQRSSKKLSRGMSASALEAVPAAMEDGSEKKKMKKQKSKKELGRRTSVSPKRSSKASRRMTTTAVPTADAPDKKDKKKKSKRKSERPSNKSNGGLASHLQEQIQRPTAGRPMRRMSTGSVVASVTGSVSVASMGTKLSHCWISDKIGGLDPRPVALEPDEEDTVICYQEHKETTEALQASSQAAQIVSRLDQQLQQRLQTLQEQGLDDDVQSLTSYSNQNRTKDDKAKAAEMLWIIDDILQQSSSSSTAKRKKDPSSSNPVKEEEEDQEMPRVSLSMAKEIQSISSSIQKSTKAADSAMWAALLQKKKQQRGSKGGLASHLQRRDRPGRRLSTGSISMASSKLGGGPDLDLESVVSFKSTHTNLWMADKVLEQNETIFDVYQNN